MNLADVFTFLFVILGFIIVYIGYWLMAVSLFPAFTERCAQRTAIAPVKTTLLGAVTLPPLIALGLTVSSKAPNAVLKLLGVGLALVALLLALFGSAGFAVQIGRGLPSPDDLQAPWRRTMRGGIVLSLTFVLPFLGWFIVMPLTFIAGFGAFLHAWLRPFPLAQEATNPPPLGTAAAPSLPIL